MARMEIALNAHLLSGDASYRSAGIHGYLYKTLAHLPAADPAIRYRVYVGAGHPPEHAALNVERASANTSNPLTRILWEQGSQPLALRRSPPDLLHGMAFSLPMLWGGPSVVTIFDLSFIRYPERLTAARRLYLRLITGRSAQKARRVIAISESGQREINRLLGIPESQIDVAIPGVGRAYQPVDPRTVADFRQRAGLPERFLLHVGTLEPRKNLDILLRAYAQLPQRDKVKLALVGGEGWGGEAIQRLIEELGLRNDLIMPGYVPGETLPMWYNAAEMFVYPSVYEGFGLPVLEAMACETPVITSDTSSLPEAAGEAGMLLPPLDVDAWTSAIARLLNTPTERATMATQGQQHAASFTWERTARQTVESYHRALSDD